MNRLQPTRDATTNGRLRQVVAALHSHAVASSGSARPMTREEMISPVPSDIDVAQSFTPLPIRSVFGALSSRVRKTFTARR